MRSRMVMILALCSTAWGTRAYAQEFKPIEGPQRIDWADGLPTQTENADGSWSIPKPLAEQIARSLIDWKNWPNLCQSAIDAESIRCNVAIDGAVDTAVSIDRIRRADVVRYGWSTMDLIIGIGIGIAFGAASFAVVR